MDLEQDIKKIFKLFGFFPIIILSILLVISFYIYQKKQLENNLFNKIEFTKNIATNYNNETLSCSKKLASLYIKGYKLDNIKDIFKNIELFLVVNKNGDIVDFFSKTKQYNYFFKGFSVKNLEIFKQYLKDKKKIIDINCDIKILFELNGFIFISIVNKNNFDDIKVDSDYSLHIFTKNYINIYSSNNMFRYKEELLNSDIYTTAIKNTKPLSLFKMEINNNDLYGIFSKDDNLFYLYIYHKDDLDINTIYFTIFIIFLLILVYLFFLKITNSIVKKVTAPLDDLIDNMDDMFKNLYNDKKLIPNTKYKRLVKLIEYFNRLKNIINKKHQELENINKTLEEQVKLKTKELEDLNKDLKIRIIQEVEKNRKKEQLLFEQNKLAAMGEMIGNIAHQWRQPLSMISTISSGISYKIELGIKVDEQDIKEGMDRITNSTQFLSKTIDDFRNFLKNDNKKGEFVIVDILKEVINIVEASLKDNYIKLIFQNGKSLKCNCIKGELTQVFLNIINNSKDAFKIRETKYDFRYILIDIKDDDNNIIIDIQDSAGGIEEKTINRIFEPYFTTKHQYSGTGIGLYMSREIIVKHHKGSISVKNNKFQIDNKTLFGANFTITLPKEIS